MANYIVLFVISAPVLVAWIALCLSKYKKWNNRKMVCTQEISVRVVDVLEKRTLKGHLLYKPIFKPVDSMDNWVIDSAYYSNLVSFQVGQTLELLVNPSNVREFIYKDDRYNKGRTADFIGCAIPLIAIIAFILISFLKG